MADKVYATNTSSSTIDMSANPPSAGQAGIAWSVTDSTSTSGAGPGTGWTQIGSWVVNTVDAQSLSLWVKNTPFAGGETSLNMTTSTVALNGAAALDGIDGTTIIDGTPPTPANNNTGAASPVTISLAITPTVNGCRIVALMGTDVLTSQDVVHTFADTGGLSWGVLADQRDGFRNCGVAIATQATAAATTVTGTGTYSSGGNAGRSLILVSLNPSGGGGAATSMPLPRSRASRLATQLHF